MDVAARHGLSVGRPERTHEHGNEYADESEELRRDGVLRHLRAAEYLGDHEEVRSVAQRHRQLDDDLYARGRAHVSWTALQPTPVHVGLAAVGAATR